MDNANNNEMTVTVITWLGTAVSIYFVVNFFLTSYLATSTFYKISNMAFSCCFLITAMVINRHRHFIEDIAGLCYCNLISFSMIFGIEIMSTNVWQGILCFCFGFMFFMVWLMTINAFLLKKPTCLGRVFL